MALTGATFAVWTSVLPKYLAELGFSPLEIALVAGASSVASIVTPLLGGQVADRWLPAERFLALSNGGAALLLFAAAGQRSFPALGGAVLAAWLFFANVLPLGSALALQHLSNPARQFPGVRAWATIGWVGGAVGLSGWLRIPGRDLGDSLWLAALLSAANAAYSLTLPHTPQRRGAAGPSAAGKVVGMLREPSFLAFTVLLFLQQAFAMFFFTNAAVFLPEVGVGRENLSAVLSIGQATEVAMVWLLPWVYGRLGAKGTIAIGMAAWVLRFGAFALGAPLWLVVASLSMHGPGFAFVRIAATIYIDRICDRDARSSAQGFLSVAVDGAGGVAGAVAAGLVATGAAGDWRTFWAVPGIGCLAILVLFLVLFRPKPAADGPA